VVSVKYVVNMLTGLRIVGAALLLFVEPLSALFFVIYIFCGLSDMFDGFLARKTNSTTTFGAVFDTVADFALMAVLLFVLLPIIHLALWAELWVAAIAVVKCASLVTGAVKFRSLAFLHTYLNKATGALLFAFPLLLRFAGITFTAVLLCAAATLAATEELVLNLTQKELIYNVKSLFCKK
jgi:CDP-diacylglycerol--glycerol-3-phosphate 3-phosphatidyltransferase